jgi:hypothetical protein
MQKELAKSYKKGNKELCAPSVSLSEITAYCNKNFNTDPDENKDCKPHKYFPNINRQGQRSVLSDLL